MKTGNVIAICDDFDGHKYVAFMLKADDFRLNDAKWGYTVVSVDLVPAPGERKVTLPNGRVARRMTDGSVTWLVFSDWSARRES